MLNSVWAILGTIVLGVATNLLTPYVGKFLVKISKSAKEKNEAKKLIFENTVQYIIDNPHEEIVLRINYLQRGLTSFLALIAGLVFMLSSNGLLILFGIVFSMLGYYGLSKSDKLGKIIERVTKIKKMSRPKIDLG